MPSAKPKCSRATPLSSGTQIERQAVDDLHVMRLQRRLDLLGPGLGAVLILVVEQQQGVDGDRRDDLFLAVTGRGLGGGLRLLDRW